MSVLTSIRNAARVEQRTPAGAPNVCRIPFASYTKVRPPKTPEAALFHTVFRKSISLDRETVSYDLNILDIDLIACKKIGALAAAVGAGSSACGGLIGLPAVLTVGDALQNDHLQLRLLHILRLFL